MTKKTIGKMMAAALCFVAASSYADAAFDKLAELARTPASSFTKANVATILDACIAVTNRTTANRIVDSKLMTFSEIFAKTKGNKWFFGTTRKAALSLGGDAELVEAFNDFVDTWITLDADDEKTFLNFSDYCVPVWKDKKFIDAGVAKAAAAKVAASNAPRKWNGVMAMIYIYPGSVYFTGRLDDACAQYKDQVIAAIKSGEVYPNIGYVDFLNYLRIADGDYETVKELLDIKWFKIYANAKNLCPQLASNAAGLRALEPKLSVVRREFLEIAKNDFQLMTVAKVQDRIDGDKKTTESIYARLSESKNKIGVALYLNDNDKLVEALMVADGSLDATTINEVITIINALDPDWRAADVLKALRVINKKYTLKLYDDRDTWEPILSKVRALIDTYNN